MRIVVISKGNADRAHTLKLLSAHNIPHEVVVDDKAAAKRIEAMDLESNVVVSGKKGVVETRNWIMHKLVPAGKWFIGLDDNISGFTMIERKFLPVIKNAVTEPPPGGKTWRQIYNRKVTPEEWLAEFESNISMADSLDIPLVGVATMENPYFRPKRYSFYRFVKTKAHGMKAGVNLRHKHTMCHDSFITAQCVARCGKVLVDNFMHYQSRMYEPGGIGASRQERDSLGLNDQLLDIVREFPGLVSIGKGENTALRFRLVTDSGVEKWRRENGYIR